MFNIKRAHAYFVTKHKKIKNKTSIIDGLVGTHKRLLGGGNGGGGDGGFGGRRELTAVVDHRRKTGVYIFPIEFGNYYYCFYLDYGR